MSRKDTDKTPYLKRQLFGLVLGVVLFILMLSTPTPQRMSSEAQSEAKGQRSNLNMMDQTLKEVRLWHKMGRRLPKNR